MTSGAAVDGLDPGLLMGQPAPRGPTLLERVLDGPERALLRIPWPATARIIMKGSLGFLRQILGSRALGRRS